MKMECFELPEVKKRGTMASQQRFNLTPHASQVTRSDRSTTGALGCAGGTVWFTGLSGAGKSTLAVALEHRLTTDVRRSCYVLDGDTLRTGLTRDLTFSPEDRTENIRRVGEVHQHSSTDHLSSRRLRSSWPMLS